MAATNQGRAAVGVFEDRAKAREAIRRLRDAGFSDAEIGVVAPGDDDVHAADDLKTGRTDATTTDDTRTGTGAAVGAAAGLGVGGLWGLGIIAGALPAIGPAIAGGALAAILSSAAAGAAAGGLIGALVGLGIPEDEAEYYHGEVARGRVLVTVQAPGRLEEAESILRDHGAYNVQGQRTGGSATSAVDRSRRGVDQGEGVGHDDRRDPMHGTPEPRMGDANLRRGAPG